MLHSDCTGVIVQVTYMFDELKARFSFFFSRCMSRKHLVTSFLLILVSPLLCMKNKSMPVAVRL